MFQCSVTVSTAQPGLSLLICKLQRQSLTVIFVYLLSSKIRKKYKCFPVIPSPGTAVLSWESRTKVSTRGSCAPLLSSPPPRASLFPAQRGGWDKARRLSEPSARPLENLTSTAFPENRCWGNNYKQSLPPRWEILSTNAEKYETA